MIESLNIYHEEMEKLNAFEYARSICQTQEEKDRVRRILFLNIDSKESLIDS